MKKRSLYLLAFLFLIVNACQQDQEAIPENEKDITIEEVQKKFNEVHSTKSREANELDIVWDRGIYKDLSVGDALYFPVKSVNPNESKHYVSIGEETKRFPVAYTSFSRAYKNDLGEVVLEYVMPVPTSNSKEFTGYLVISDWGDEVKRLVYYEEGILVADHGASTFEGTDTESLRKSSNCVIIDHYWCVTVTVGEDVSITRCTYEGSTMTCKEPPVLAGPNPGPEFGGGGPSEPSGPDGLCAHPFIEGLYVNCDEVICSDGFVSDGNGGCIADITTALTPLNEGDDINNPYDGMQVYDSKGVIYTYNSELQSWLMPEISTLLNNSDFDLQMPTPPTESAIVITMAPIAFGEPTFVGEVILAGTFVVVGTIYIYEFAKYLRDVRDADREHCTTLYVRCSTRFGYKNMDCATCQQYCNAQGYWNFEICPLRD
jgi:hypothetical protein